MRFLLEPTEADTLEALDVAAHAVHAAGLDGMFVAPTALLPAPLITAAAVGARVGDILIAAEVPLGDRHPIEVAEEAAVVDLALAGRLILVVTPAGEHFEEALELLRLALTPRPFTFAGRRWQVPTTRVTPSPFQARLPVWRSDLHRERWRGAEALVTALRAARPAWAVVRGPASAAPEIGARVRPRVQLDELPPGLEAHWERY